MYGFAASAVGYLGTIKMKCHIIVLNSLQILIPYNFVVMALRAEHFLFTFSLQCCTQDQRSALMRGLILNVVNATV